MPTVLKLRALFSEYAICAGYEFDGYANALRAILRGCKGKDSRLRGRFVARTVMNLRAHFSEYAICVAQDFYEYAICAAYEAYLHTHRVQPAQILAD